MKIAYVTGASVPSTTAHASYAANLCDALGRDGNETMLVAVKGPLDLASFRRRYAHVALHLIGFAGLHRRSNLKLLLLAGILFARGKSWQADSIFIAHNDIIAAALAFRGRKFVFDLHNFGPNARLLKYALQSPACAGCIFSARTAKAAFEARFGAFTKPALILGNAVDPSALKPRGEKSALRLAQNIPEGRTVIAYIGSMGEHRGIDLMLETAARTRARNLFWLFVGGKPEDVALWQSRAAALGLDGDAVRFAGFQPQETLGDWYEIADILCAPYRRELQGFGHLASMKLLEYRAVGKPVIVSEMPFAREIFSPEEAVFFDPDAPLSLDSALADALRGTGRPVARAVETWDVKARALAAWLSTLEGTLA